MKTLLIILLAVLSVGVIYAQKLPNIQEASIRAPANIKIDGNLNEWNNQLQAYNKVDGLYYTVSNDDINLYLTLIAPYKFAAEKIVRGGVMFSVSKIGDKKRKDDPSVKAIDFVLLKNDQRQQLLESFQDYLSKKN